MRLITLYLSLEFNKIYGCYYTSNKKFPSVTRNYTVSPILQNSQQHIQILKMQPVLRTWGYDDNVICHHFESTQFACVFLWYKKFKW